MTAMLSTLNLGVRLGERDVLHGVTLQLHAGWTAVVGPNGAGKSTLLRALAGLLTPAQGELSLLGQPLAAWSARERGQRLAWLAQQGQASGELAVRDVVHLGRLPHLGLWGSPGPADEDAVNQAMRDTECLAWATRSLDELSGGERQRVLLARALAVGAPVLLLDEPTTHLDPPHQVALVRLLQQRAASQCVVSVLHDVALALQAQRLLVLQDGRVLAHGPVQDSAVRAAVVAVFKGALRVEALGAGFVAVPNL